jgi:hypothetical protein
VKKNFSGKRPLLLLSEVKIISVGKEALLLFSGVKNNFSGERTSAAILRVKK